jgi:hypothetical protein
MDKRQIEIKENTFQLTIGDVELDLTRAEMQELYYAIKGILNLRDDNTPIPYPVNPVPVSPTDPWPTFPVPVPPMTPFCGGSVNPNFPKNEETTC